MAEQMGLKVTHAKERVLSEEHPSTLMSTAKRFHTFNLFNLSSNYA